MVFIHFTMFLLHSLASSSFLFLLRYSFLNFYFISTCLMVSASNPPMYLYVFFSPSFLIFFSIWYFIPSVMCRLPLFIISMAHYLCFSNNYYLMVFHRSFSCSKPFQVSWTLLDMQTDRVNAVVWMTTTCFFFPKSSCSLINFFMTVPRTLASLSFTQ